MKNIYILKEDNSIKQEDKSISKEKNKSNDEIIKELLPEITKPISFENQTTKQLEQLVRDNIVVTEKKLKDKVILDQELNYKNLVYENKMKTLQFLKKNKFNVVETSYKSNFNYPFVMKTNYSTHGDNGVYLVKDPNEEGRIEEKYGFKNLIYQQYIDNEVKEDYRLVIFFDDTTLLYKRKSNSDEFRTNRSKTRTNERILPIDIAKDKQLSNLVKRLLLVKKTSPKTFSFAVDIILDEKDNTYKILGICNNPSLRVFVKDFKMESYIRNLLLKYLK